LGEFEEAGACGTAAIISPIREIFDRETGETFTYGDGEAGPVTTKLYNKLRAIQYGEEPDPYGWTKIIIE
ncbi:MAG: branched chain amino acid aminotransferase, partial [Bacteroidetes bacterium]|nr:branched chain amino acid aminotransferase [Bacteroidota bacterium]